MPVKKILQFDKTHLWHPYDSVISPGTVYPVARAKGPYIFLEDGTKLLDGMASWWCAVHGYNHPRLNRAVRAQLTCMSHVMFGGFTHRPAVNLGSELLRILPPRLNRIFFCDSGSVAVEAALKMALQFFHNKKKERNLFISFKGGYHGDTFHAMSVSDPGNSMHSVWKKALPRYIFAPRPSRRLTEEPSPGELSILKKLFRTYGAKTAAFICEPVVQGAGGMRFYSPGYLSAVRELCGKYGVLLIYDEIASAFWRTGKMFAFEHTNTVPDILCIGKAMSGGYVSIAAAICTDSVARGICGTAPGLFMHGPTFMANPLACAVSAESVKMLRSPAILRSVKNIEHICRKMLSPLQVWQEVHEVRVLGGIAVIEMKEKVDTVKFQKLCIRQGIWVRPFGKLVYLMPPYILNSEEVRKLCRGLITACIQYVR